MAEITTTTYSLGRIGLRIMGAYSASTEYQQLDVVTYQGSSYAAKDACSNVAPTDTQHWSLLAQGNPVFNIGYADTLPATGSTGQILFVPAG